MDIKQAIPSHTYATPKRAINSVDKMNVKDAQFVISKDSQGRYFPVFVENARGISANEMQANPSANRDMQGPQSRGRKTVTKRAAKKATKRAARKTTRKPAKKTNGNGRRTLH